MKNEIDKTIWETYKDFYGALTAHEDMRNNVKKQENENESKTDSSS